MTALTYRGWAATGDRPEPLVDYTMWQIDTWHNTEGRSKVTRDAAADWLTDRGWFPSPGLQPDGSETPAGGESPANVNAPECANERVVGASSPEQADEGLGVERPGNAVRGALPGGQNPGTSTTRTVQVWPWPRLTQKWIDHAGADELVARLADERGDLARGKRSAKSRIERIENELERRGVAEAINAAGHEQLNHSSGVAAKPAEGATDPRPEAGEAVLPDMTDYEDGSGKVPPNDSLSTSLAVPESSSPFVLVETRGMGSVDVPTQAPETRPGLLPSGLCSSCATRETDMLRAIEDIDAYGEELARAKQEVERLRGFETAYAELRDRVTREPLKRIRCSSLPLALRCGGSQRPLWTQINPDNEAARLGSAVHEALAHLAGAFFDDEMPNRLVELAERYRVLLEGADSLSYLYSRGASALQRLVDKLGEPDFVEHRIEATIPGTEATLTGTMDLGFVRGDTLYIVDHKSGRLEKDHSDQLRGYGYGAIPHISADIKRIGIIVVWLREDGSKPGQPRIDSPVYYTPDQLEEWAATDLAGAVKWDGQFAPGDHCEHCPIRAGCQAHRDWAREQVAILLDETYEPDDLDQVVRLRDAARAVAKVVKAADERTRDVVLERGRLGPYRVREERRDTLLSDRVAAALDGLGVDPWDAAKVSKSAVYKAAKAAGHTPKRIAKALREAEAFGEPRVVRKVVWSQPKREATQQSKPLPDGGE